MPPARALLLSLLLVPGLGIAQTTGNSLTLDFQGRSEEVVTSSDCGQNRAVTWRVTLAGGGTPCTDLLLWVTLGNCNSDGPGTDDQDLGAVSSSEWASSLTGTVQIPINDLPLFTQAGGTPCGGAVVQQDMKVCAQYKYAPYLGTCSSPQVVRVSTSPTIRFDNQPPVPPTLSEVVPLDGALSVTVSASSDTFAIHLEYRQDDPSGATGFTSSGSFTVDRSTARIDGLSNGTLYEIRARAEDSAGNLGDYSNIVKGTPVHTEGFLDRYLNAGGQETGGCATAGGGTAVWLALVVGLRLISRRRHS